MFAQQQISLKGRALRALAGREYSRVELERKLGSFEEAPGQLAALLDELQAKGFWMINVQPMHLRIAEAKNSAALGWWPR